MTTRINKNQKLQVMGITAWTLRDQPIAQPVLCYQLRNAAQQPMGVLLAEVTDDLLISINDQQDLLHKIAQAITPQCSPCELTPVRYACVILLGSDAKKVWESQSLPCDRLITSYSLVQIIQQPEYKKQLWADIKSLRELFHD